MGIQSLTKFIEENAPDSIRMTNISSYRGSKIAVDAAVVIYQCITSPMQCNTIDDKKRKSFSCLVGILKLVEYLLKNRVWPVFVFDGETAFFKDAQMMKRCAEEIRFEKWLDEAIVRGDKEEINRLRSLPNKPMREIIEECKHLLRLLGIPYLVAPGEGAALCSALARAGIVCAVATTDTDALAFGTTAMFPDIVGTHSGNVKEYNHDDMLRSLSITRAQFIDLCILLGCNFCDKISGIGPGNVLEIIRSHASIEGIIQCGKFEIPNNWNYHEGRHLFVNDLGYFDELTITFNNPDEELLKKYLGAIQGSDINIVRGFVGKMSAVSFTDENKTATLCSYHPKSCSHNDGCVPGVSQRVSGCQDGKAAGDSEKDRSDLGSLNLEEDSSDEDILDLEDKSSEDEVLDLEGNSSDSEPLDLEGESSGSEPMDLEGDSSDSSPLDLEGDSSDCSPLDLEGESSGSEQMDLRGDSSDHGSDCSPLDLEGESSGSDQMDLEGDSSDHGSDCSPLDLKGESSGSEQMDLEEDSSDGSPLDWESDSSDGSPLDLEGDSSDGTSDLESGSSDCTPLDSESDSSDCSLLDLEGNSSDDAYFDSEDSEDELLGSDRGELDAKQPTVTNVTIWNIDHNNDETGDCSGHKPMDLEGCSSDEEYLYLGSSNEDLLVLDGREVVEQKSGVANYTIWNIDRNNDETRDCLDNVPMDLEGDNSDEEYLDLECSDQERLDLVHF